MITGLKKCRIISRYAIGVDTIDVEAARGKGIAVANVPDYCIEEVSDTAMAHILNCVRKVTQAHDLLHSGAWAYAKIKPIRRFAALTIGLVAFGHIAQAGRGKTQAFREPNPRLRSVLLRQGQVPVGDFLVHWRKCSVARMSFPSTLP